MTLFGPCRYYTCKFDRENITYYTYFKIQKKTYTKMNAPFKSDLINNMDHIRITVLNPHQ